MASPWNAYLATLDLKGIPGIDGKPFVVAHRGYSAIAPENTLPAIDAAALLGCDFIEFDVALTRDRVPVLLHDDTLGRTTDANGKLAAMDWAQAREADAGSWRGEGYTGQRIPTLAQTLAAARRQGGRLLIEFKDYWPLADIENAAALLRESGLDSSAVVQSFNVDTVKNLRAVLPDVPRGLLRYIPRLEDLGLIEELGVVTYNPGLRGFHMRTEVCRDIVAAGIGVMVWTADRPTDWERLLGAGISGVITNQPGRLQGYLAAKFDVF